MPAKDFVYDHHIVNLLSPAADAFAGGVDTDVLCLRNYRSVAVVVATGAIEDAGISNLVTVKACTDTSKTGATAMPFRYRVCRSSATVDTWSAGANADAAGYNFAANNPVANAIWIIEFTADDVGAALNNADCAYVSIAETANKTITAGIVAILSSPREPRATPRTAIAED